MKERAPLSQSYKDKARQGCRHILRRSAGGKDILHICRYMEDLAGQFLTTESVRPLQKNMWHFTPFLSCKQEKVSISIFSPGCMMKDYFFAFWARLSISLGCEAAFNSELLLFVAGGNALPLLLRWLHFLFVGSDLSFHLLLISLHNSVFCHFSRHVKRLNIKEYVPETSGHVSSLITPKTTSRYYLVSLVTNSLMDLSFAVLSNS